MLPPSRLGEEVRRIDTLETELVAQLLSGLAAVEDMRGRRRREVKRSCEENGVPRVSEEGEGR